MELEISVEDLLNKRKIESDRIEFKAGWNPDDIYHSVCAFANDYNNDGGGYIVVGVEEKNGVAVRPVKGISEYMLDEIQKEMVDFEQIDVDKISKKLKATVTTGDYAKIEKAIKNYMADNLNTMLTISEALNDEVIPNALTAENYQNDGPDFVKTRKILKNTQDKLSASKETMIILSKDDTVMSYLKNVDDSYYIDLYKEMVGEESSVDDIKKNIDDIVNLIQSQQNVLEFLSENKNMWNVQNGKIQFDDDILLNQYNQLLLAVQ